MLPCKFNVWFPSSFASQHNAWCQGKTFRLREAIRPGAGLARAPRTALQLMAASFGKKGCALLRVLFCLALQSAVSFTSGDLSNKHQLSINPVSTLEIMRHNRSLSPHWICRVLWFQGMTACTPPSVSVHSHLPRRFCCMEWVLVSKIQAVRELHISAQLVLDVRLKAHTVLEEKTSV